MILTSSAKNLLIVTYPSLLIVTSEMFPLINIFPSSSVKNISPLFVSIWTPDIGSEVLASFTIIVDSCESNRLGINKNKNRICRITISSKLITFN